MNIRLGVLAALAFLVAGTGCANNKTSAERDSLLNQNKELQQQLDAEHKGRTDADARATALTNQNTTPPAESPTPPSMAAGGGEGGTLDLSGGSAGRGGRSAAPSRTATPAPSVDGVASRTNSAGEVVMEIQGDVLFDSGKATIKASAKKTLDNVAAQIKKSYSGQTLRIEGHTDASPVKGSGWDDNWDLGAARARAVLLYLTTKGIPQKNMYLASFAANEPKSTKTPSLNRRVEIVVVKNAK